MKIKLHENPKHTKITYAYLMLILDDNKYNIDEKTLWKLNSKMLTELKNKGLTLNYRKYSDAEMRGVQTLLGFNFVIDETLEDGEIRLDNLISQRCALQ